MSRSDPPASAAVEMDPAPLVTRIDKWTYTVPSRSEVQADGEPLVRIVTIEEHEGTAVLACDCPGFFLGHRRSGPCWHAKQVARFLKEARHG